MKDRRATAAELRKRISAAMQADIGVSEKLALPFVDSVMKCLAGERAYFPMPIREYPIADIRQSLREGVTPLQVTKRYQISRSKLHELFPGGLPKRQVQLVAD